MNLTRFSSNSGGSTALPHMLAILQNAQRQGLFVGRGAEEGRRAVLSTQHGDRDKRHQPAIA